MSGRTYDPKRARGLAGVGDQRRCPNGTVGCPGADGDELACVDCFLEGGDSGGD